MARKPAATAAPTSDGKERPNTLPSDPHKEAIDALFEEAKLWFEPDFKIATEAEAEGVEKLLKQSREAWTAADTERAGEKKPHDDAGKAVQARYKPILDRADRIGNVCKAVLKPWREALEAKRRAEAEEAAENARQATARAADAAAAAGNDIGAQEIADQAAEDAARLTKNAARFERDAGKGLNLRKSFIPVVDDYTIAARHYWKEHPGRFAAVVDQLAAEDARKAGGPPAVPGVRFVEDRKAV